MTLTLTLTPERETWISAQARAAGLSPEQYALSLIDSQAPGARSAQGDAQDGATQTDPTLALFAQWDMEDATDDPEELARRERVNAETAEQLRRSRFSLEGRTDFRRPASEQDGEAAA